MGHPCPKVLTEISSQLDLNKMWLTIDKNRFDEQKKVSRRKDHEIIQGFCRSFATHYVC